MSKLRKQILVAALLAASSYAGISAASNSVTLETVSDYTTFSGGGTGNNTDANTEGKGFWNAITAAGTPWTAGVWFYDNSVFDTDFYDPDMTGNNVDNDTSNFDQPSGIAFFIGHGTCDDVTNTKCAKDSDCGANAYCPNFPLGSGQSAACIVNSTRRMITSSTADRHGHFVLYGSGNVSMALGESPNSGSFDGAGTNGGSNIAIITNSCGFRSRYITPTDLDQPRFYAGVHEIMVNMPVGNTWGSGGNSAADTAQWSARGSTLANLILTNVNAPAKNAWLTPSFTTSSFNGAGANVVGSFDVNQTTAQNRLVAETWAQSTDDTRDSTSSGGGWLFWTCSFSNCSSFRL